MKGSRSIKTTNEIDKIIEVCEFLLNNRLLKRNESSIYAMRALYQSTSSSLLKLRSKILLNRDPEDFSFPEYKELIQEYSDLVNHLSEEPKFQSFFEANPFFLNLQVVKTLGKKSFGGELIPDYVLELSDKSILVVEIEKPAFKLYNRDGDPTHELGHAEEQIRGYISWATKNNSFLREHGIENLNPDKIMGLVIIGANLSETEQNKLDARNKSQRSDFIVKTFSDICRENQAFLSNLAAKMRKQQ